MTELLTLEQRHERAERRVNRFVGRFEPSYHDLVCHVALPLILTPELVSYLRNEFLREVPWIAEVDLLLSDLCSPVGYELYMMDADVRAYALTKCSTTLTADRKREVANLLISYVRYLAQHQSYLSDRELEAQQWAAMLCLGESECQTVVSELVKRFQSAETGGAMVGADLLDHAELARLAQLIETFKPQLTDYPELIEYAALVSDVQLRNIALERTRLEKTYVVAPGQFLSLPAALRTELVAKGRIQARDVPQPNSQGLQSSASAQSAEESPAESSGSVPPLETFEFIEAHFEEEVDEALEREVSPAPDLQPSDLEPFEFTVVTLRPRSGQQQGLRNLFRRQTQQTTEWDLHRQQQRAYRWVETLPGDIPLEMVAIPGGTFAMGSPEDEPERYKDESPEHEVSVEPFFMGRYPITQWQWQAVAQLPQVERELNPDPSRFKGQDHPVEQVSWYDVVEFCARLSAHTGRTYRLPTEAEWEYTCRAGSITPFHFGDMITTEVANYNGSAYNNGPAGDSRGGTTPVDHFEGANAFGLSDMHGNVWEWCQDAWHDSYKDAPSDGSAWLEGGDPSYRVLRGGSWYFNPGLCRSASRGRSLPAFRLVNGDGFRVCCGGLRGLVPAPRT